MKKKLLICTLMIAYMLPIFAQEQLHDVFRLSAYNAALPDDLKVDGIPISEACMYELMWLMLGEKGQPTSISISKYQNRNRHDGDEFTWEYKGTLPGAKHVILFYTHPEGAMGKFTMIAIIKRQGDTLEYAGAIHGGDRHSTMIHYVSVEGEKIIFSQGVASGSFCEVLENLGGVDEFPLGHCIGEACYMGAVEWEAMLQKNGDISKKFISFSPAECGEEAETLLPDGPSQTIESKNLAALKKQFIIFQSKDGGALDGDAIRDVVAKARAAAFL